MYEYKFVKLEYTGGAILQYPKHPSELIQRHAQEGWRLVQIWSPGPGQYPEIIFERPAQGG